VSLSAVVRDLPDRPDLAAQVLLGCPPQFLVVEGVRRTWGRELTVAEAVDHAERGRPAYLLTFSKCVQLSPSLLARVLADDDFQRSASSGEAVVRMYGRHGAGEPDTRLVIAAAARHVD
jgi:hypothetical protein